MGICNYCNKEFASFAMANHSRWCELNTKRNEYVDVLNKNRFKSNDTSKKTSLRKNKRTS